MTDQLPEGLPHDFNLNQADRGDRVTAADGTTYVVLESQLDTSRTLVAADVVEYDRVDHPLVTGLAGFMTVLATFIVPLWGALQVFPALGGTLVTIGGLGVTLFGAWLTANVVLYRTPFGDEVFRFLEWQDHHGAVLALRRHERTDDGAGGETA